MDYDQNDDYSNQPQPPDRMREYEMNRSMSQPKKRFSGWRVFFGVILAMSILGNVFLFFMLIGIISFFAVGQVEMLSEEVVVRTHDSCDENVVIVNFVQNQETP